MPKIENSTVIKHAKPICDALNKRGQNWNWEANAALIVRVVLEELGALEQLGEEYKADRQAVVKVIEKFGYPKNFQNVYLAKTEVDGKPLMPAVDGKAETEASEFA
jgi:histidinol-phosphate/aromatic aminotransferase/cobyric acid decarboxylase-like protein